MVGGSGAPMGLSQGGGEPREWRGRRKLLEVPKHLWFDGSEGTWKLYRQLFEKKCRGRGLDESQARHLLEASLPCLFSVLIVLQSRRY